ncbi:MAG: DUF5009 domain-containing protein [Candidatus Hydrogenedentota bacterium]
MSDTSSAKPALSAGGRIMAIDALRGFDMFWIVGADDLVRSMGKASDSGVVQAAATQLKHVPWEGFVFYDLIFPLFVFLIGVSLVFSLTRLVDTEGKTGAYKRLARRALLMFFFGWFYDHGFAQMPDENPFVGVMQRLAICYFFAGLLYMNLKLRGLIVTFLLLIIGYWAALSFVPFPGKDPENAYSKDANLTRYVDSLYLPFREPGQVTDPEGLLGNFPAVASCLLGVFAGLLIRNAKYDMKQKSLYFLAAGVALCIAGYVWGFQFPIIKRIWTSTYVLYAGGWSCILLGLFILIIDVAGWKKWAIPFVWIGANPLTIYIVNSFVDFSELGARLTGGPLGETLFGQYDEIVASLVGIGFVFLFVRFLYKKQIFLRV